jgi:Fic family protein
MDESRFRNGPGRVEPYDGLPCYNPDSLPPEIDLSPELLEAHGEAVYELGRLSTLHDDIDNENLLLAPFVVREAAMSSRIEGTNVTVSDIILHEPEKEPQRSAASSRDIREAYNYVDAINVGFDALENGNRITRELLCDLHELLLVDVRGENKRPGTIRESPVVIGDSKNPADAEFVPANPNHVSLLLDQLVNYIRMGYHPPLVDVALAHYQFEAIHPFRDGNGRLGRLLIMLQLYDAGLLPEPYLYLSTYFNRNRQEYFDKLLAVSRDGTWEEWIVFVLDAIAEQAADAYICGKELVDLRENYCGKYPQRPVVRTVIEHLFMEPYLRASRVYDTTDHSKSAIYDAIDTLERDGIIEEVTDKQRNRVFRAPEILSVVGSR